MADRPPEHKIAHYFIIPQRIILSILSFLGMVIAYTMRVSLSLIITQLVVPRNYSQEHIDSQVVCPLEEGAEVDESVGSGTYDWSQEMQGIILCSFFVGYFLSHVPAGMLAGAFGGKWVLSLGVLSTAVFTLLTPLVIVHGGAEALIVLRVLMGLGQGTLFPSLGALVAQWIPMEERSTLGSFIMGGGQIGVVVATLGSGILLDNYEWPIVFYIYGIIALIWFALFTFICYSSPAEHPYIKQYEKEYLMSQLGMLVRTRNIGGTPWKAIFSNLIVWCLLAAQIGHDWGFYVMCTSLPKYMNDVLQFSIKSNGLYPSLPFLGMWIASILSSIIADVLHVKNWLSLTNIRKIMTGIAAFGPAIFIIWASYAGCDRIAVVTLFIISMVVMGLYYAGLRLSPVDISPNFAGVLIGITNGTGSLTGIFSPYLVGLMTPSTTMEEWRGVFWLAFLVFTLFTMPYCIWGTSDIQPFNEMTTKNEETL